MHYYKRNDPGNEESDPSLSAALFGVGGSPTAEETRGEQAQCSGFLAFYMRVRLKIK